MLHKNSARFFANHKDKKEFWFTPDGQHFFTQEGADAHAITLKRNGKKNEVEHVTREEIESEAPGADGDTGKQPGKSNLPDKAVVLDTDSDELKGAKNSYNAAIDVKAALLPEASIKEKGDATKAINAAKKVLDALVTPA